MKDFVITDRLILSRYLFEETHPLSVEDVRCEKRCYKTSAEALSKLIKDNRESYGGILGWWDDIASPYSAKKHILEDHKLWRQKRQLQYYVYEKNGGCVGIVCALCENKTAYMLEWLSKSVQGRRYASEIQTAMDRELFVTMNLSSVVQECWHKNPHFVRVQSFLTHMGYTVSQKKEFSVIWTKSREAYFKENPHLCSFQNEVRKERQWKSFFKILALLIHQRGKELSGI